jgi:hypothetical protein
MDARQANRTGHPQANGSCRSRESIATMQRAIGGALFEDMVCIHA